MIIINKPFIENLNGKVYLKAIIKDDTNKLCEACHFVTEEEYGKYFCDEVSDAFVIGLLLPALQSNQDIIVKGAMSEKLYFNLTNTVIFLLSIAFNYKPIRIVPDNLVSLNFESFAVGTGCSLGVDSFSTIIKHSSDKVPASYRLTHLAYFNAGSHGEENFEEVHKSFQNDLVKLYDFSKEINLPLIPIETNISLFYTSTNFDYNQTNVIRNVCVVLSFQKFYKKYIFSSTYPIQEFKITDKNLAYFQSILLPAFSTNNTEIIDGDPELNRSDKTLLIANNDMVHKHLHVCLSDLVRNNNMLIAPWIKLKTDKRNCTGCEKCLRTLVTLDILGKKENFNEIFDLRKYQSLRNLYLAKILGMKNRDYFCMDIYNLAIFNKFKIPFISRLLSLFYSLKINELFYWIISKRKTKPKYFL